MDSALVIKPNLGGSSVGGKPLGNCKSINQITDLSKRFLVVVDALLWPEEGVNSKPWTKLGLLRGR